MIAFILAAGASTRLKPYTLNKHKSLIEVLDNKKIIDIELKNLRDNGVRDVVIAVGHFKEKIETYVKSNYSDMNFIFVNNEKYGSTNCIYSMWLCRKHLNEDMIFLTGDLVFESKVIKEMIYSKFNNIMYVNSEAEINEKNFKVEVGNNGFIKEIGVNLFGKNVKMAYPLYKLSKPAIQIWMKEIDNYIQQDKTNLYGEIAFNNVADKINLMPMRSTDFCMEIDDHEDLLEAKNYYEKNGLK
jgi:choline kinase